MIKIKTKQFLSHDKYPTYATRFLYPSEKGDKNTKILTLFQYSLTFII